MKPDNLSNWIKRYLAGESAAQLGKELGVKGDTFSRWLIQLGVETRSGPESHLAASPVASRVAEIISRYLAGESENQLALALNVSRQVIRRRLTGAGVSIRNQAAAELLKWSRSTIDIRQTQTAAAQDARRGQVDSLEVQAKRARSWYERRCHIAPEEDRFASLLRVMEYPISQQLPIGAYNVDLALTGSPVAVEIERGSWSNNRTFGDYRQRLEYIFNQGWCVLIVYIKGRIQWGPVMSKIITWLELTRRNKALAGQYGMIRCNGEPTTTCCVNFDGLPRIPGF